MNFSCMQLPLLLSCTIALSVITTVCDEVPLYSMQPKQHSAIVTTLVLLVMHHTSYPYLYKARYCMHALGIV
jgi:hypothetical protein